MSDHLPECPMLHEQYPKHPLENCDYCNMLRACEQRVLLSKPNIELSAVYGYEAGRSDGLSAARDAVAAVRPFAGYEWNTYMEHALAAIDALRGESNG